MRTIIAQIFALFTFNFIVYSYCDPYPNDGDFEGPVEQSFIVHCGQAQCTVTVEYYWRAVYSQGNLQYRDIQITKYQWPNNCPCYESDIISGIYKFILESLVDEFEVDPPYYPSEQCISSYRFFSAYCWSSTMDASFTKRIACEGSPCCEGLYSVCFTKDPITDEIKAVSVEILYSSFIHGQCDSPCSSYCTQMLPGQLGFPFLKIGFLENELKNDFFETYSNIQPSSVNDEFLFVLNTKLNGDFELIIFDILGRSINNLYFTKFNNTFEMNIYTGAISSGHFRYTVKQNGIVIDSGTFIKY